MALSMHRFTIYTAQNHFIVAKIGNHCTLHQGMLLGVCKLPNSVNKTPCIYQQRFPFTVIQHLTIYSFIKKLKSFTKQLKAQDYIVTAIIMHKISNALSTSSTSHFAAKCFRNYQSIQFIYLFGTLISLLSYLIK